MPALIDIGTLGLQLFPIEFFFLLCLGIFKRLGRKKIIRDDFVISWAGATVATGLAMIGFTLLASSINGLTPGFCRSCWLLSDLVLIVGIAGMVQWNFRLVAGGVRAQLVQWRFQFGVQPSMAKVMLVGSAAFLLVLGIFAIETPTTIWDSHTYHMPRIMHWFQQRNLDDYPTNIPRQIEYPPGAEMTIAQ